MIAKDLVFWIWLSSLTTLRQKARVALWEEYGSPERIWNAAAASNLSFKGMTQSDRNIISSRNLDDAAEILSNCARQGISVIPMSSPDYPERLKNIYCPPFVLYVKGILPPVDELPVISVIGTRKASTYGLKMGRQLAFDISKSGALIVSLLTAGIDSSAAEGALLAGNGCIGVLGTPHEGEKSSLVDEIAVNGAVISEYPPGAGRNRSYFRERNRIAAGLSLGVVVVEAPENSGTAFFVSEALDQGKEIFAVPGNADSENSAGTLRLLRLGATPVGNGWDVLAGYRDVYPFLRKNSETVPDYSIQKHGAQDRKNEPAISDTAKSSTSSIIDWRDVKYGLSDDQLKIVSVLMKGPGSVDSIIVQSEMRAQKVLSQLTILEIKGVVTRSAAKIYQLITEKK